VAVPSRHYEFGPFRLDAAGGVLFCGEGRLALRPKLVEVLVVLVEAQGKPVGKQELFERVWANSIVEEGSLTSHISLLRKALEEKADGCQFIETLPKRGYRFVGAVKEVAEPAAQATSAKTVEEREIALRTPRTLVGRLGLAVAGILAMLAILVTLNLDRVRQRFFRSSSSVRIESLAVLPLENLTGDPGQDYFADGLTDELITELARLHTIRVVSRRSVMAYRGVRLAAPRIAQDLHVDALVEGSVVRSGTRVRITAQLIDARTDRHMWAQSFEGELRDLVTLQDDLARKITEQIRSQLPPTDEATLARKRTLDPDVHDLYIRGIVLRDVNDKISLDKSIQCFEQALQKDPHYAPAYAGLAVAYTFESYLGVQSSQETFQRAEVAARKAIEEDPSLGEAHAALAWVAIRYRWDWPTAESEVKKALELNPNDPDAHHFYSHYLLDMGRMEEGLEEGQKGLLLDPLSEIQRNHLVWQYEIARQFDRAIALGKKILESSATDPDQYNLVAGAYAGNGQLEAAALTLKKGISLSPARTGPRIALARILALSGNASEAREILDTVEHLPASQFVSPMDIAAVYCALGEKPRAFEWLERAYRKHDTGLADLKILPTFDCLHGEPRFQELLRRIGLPS
jgi:TolB-like protein/DNA-binding winged helix-turn-helix (wHTH) protein/tetratricopeptide (TPR) repeat protein